MTEVSSRSSWWTDLIHGQGLRARLLRGGVGSLFVKAASMVLTLATMIVLARVLGADGYGVYSFVFAITSLLAAPAQLGLPALLVRETAKAHARNDDSGMRGVWAWAGKLALTSSLALMCIGGGIAVGVAGQATDGQWTLWAWGIALIPLIAFGNLRGAALQGVGRVAIGQAPELIIRPALLTIFCLLGWAILGRVSPAEAMAANFAGAVIAFVFGAMVLKRHTPRAPTRTPDKSTRRAWLLAIWPLAAIAGMQAVNMHTGVVALGLFDLPAEAGVFRIVVQGATLVAAGMTAINAAAAPHFARLHTQGDIPALQRAAAWTARGTLVTAAIAALPLLVMPAAILGLVFGDEFTAGAAPLAWVVLGQVISAALGPVGILMMMCGGERRMARLLIVSALLNLALNLTLTPIAGLMGAAIAHASATVFLSVGLWLAVKRLTGVSGWAFARTRHA